jgi:hypothetical protein
MTNLVSDTGYPIVLRRRAELLRPRCAVRRGTCRNTSRTRLPKYRGRRTMRRVRRSGDGDREDGGASRTTPKGELRGDEPMDQVGKPGRKAMKWMVSLGLPGVDAEYPKATRRNRDGGYPLRPIDPASQTEVMSGDPLQADSTKRAGLVGAGWYEEGSTASEISRGRQDRRMSWSS